MTMEISRFIAMHKSEWTELEQLTQQLGRGKSRLQANHLDRFTELYKAVSAHLATLQTYRPADDTTLYLNQLVAKAHNMMYKENNKSSQQLRVFFLRHFPAMLRKRKLFFVFALLLFIIGGLAGFLAVWKDPLNVYQIIPANIAGGIDPSQTDQPRGDLHSPIVSTTIMTNNIRVAVLAFISGITLGIGTVYLLVTNGLLIGALAAVFMHSGKSYVFWAYILPHGIIELTAIFIAGGAGLYMGYRIFVPGPFSRKYLFLESVKESAQLLLGTLPLFVIAGIIEGYITPSTLNLEFKYMISGATLVLLTVYYVLGSRSWSASTNSTHQSASLDLRSR
jgi:uncharacterized membrane protein SpoIIM required for sporulation